MISMTRRSRLYRRFRPIIDGLVDKARSRAEESYEEQFNRDWFGGQWQRSHPHSYALQIAESTGGNPVGILSRALSMCNRGEVRSVALVVLDDAGVIHTAWSDGDRETLSVASKFLSDDLRTAK
jgi:hypothetical protein